MTEHQKLEAAGEATVEDIEQVKPAKRRRKVAVKKPSGRGVMLIVPLLIAAVGLFFWLTLNNKLDTRTLLQPAMAQNVAFMPGEPFFTEPDANLGHLRLNFSHVPPEKLGEGLRRLAAVVREAQGGQ